MSALILLAGHETTTNLLTNEVVTLTRHPEQLDLLASSPELVKGAVEEVLRYEGPVKVLTRWVIEDHERGGRTIKEAVRSWTWTAVTQSDPQPSSVALNEQRCQAEVNPGAVRPTV